MKKKTPGKNPRRLVDSDKLPPSDGSRTIGVRLKKELLLGLKRFKSKYSFDDASDSFAVRLALTQRFMEEKVMPFRDGENAKTHEEYVLHSKQDAAKREAEAAARKKAQAARTPPPPSSERVWKDDDEDVPIDCYVDDEGRLKKRPTYRPLEVAADPAVESLPKIEVVEAEAAVPPLPYTWAKPTDPDQK